MDRNHTAAIALEERGTIHAMQRIAFAAPSWLASAVLHAVIFLIMCQIQWNEPGKLKNLAVVAGIDRKPWEDEIIEPPITPPKLDPDPIDPIEADVDLAGNANMDSQGPELAMAENPPGLREFVDNLPPITPVIGLPSERPGYHGPQGPSAWGFRDRTKVPGGWPPREPRKELIAGLEWLKNAQGPDGRWDSQKWGANHNCDAAVSGLAILCFLANGDTDREGDYRQTVSRGLTWLVTRQQADGSFGERFYTQGICTMALSQAYGMSQTPALRMPAQRAADFCCASQNPNGGWDYNGNNPARVDTSVSAWVVLGLKSACTSGLNVPQESIDRVKQWLRESINPDGTTGYTKTIGAQGSSGGTPTMTAASTLCRQMMGWTSRDPEIMAALDYIQKAGPTLNNLYHTYYVTLTMFQVKRVDSIYWVQWRNTFTNPLISLQLKGRGKELDGSWDPDQTYGAQGGRVYSTAMALFCLEVETIYLPMMR